MGVSCDRPFPYFKARIDKFLAREQDIGCCGGVDVEYDLGYCYLAYKNIIELYNAACDVLEKKPKSKKQKRLRDACEKTYMDFARAKFLIDEEEIKTKKSRWGYDWGK